MSVDVRKIKVGDTVTGSFVVQEICSVSKRLWGNPLNGSHGVLRFDQITSYEPAKVPVQIGDKFKVSASDTFPEEVVHIHEGQVISVYLYEDNGRVYTTNRPLSLVQEYIEEYGNFKDESQ